MGKLTSAWFLAILPILTSSCTPPATVKPDSGIREISAGTHLLGPESFPFCQGWVEIWAQIRPHQDPLLHLKLSPPNGAKWHVWNSHVVVESDAIPGKPLKFDGFKDFDTSDERGNVVRWTVDVPSALLGEKGLKVALRPFTGCAADQAIRGVVLKNELPVVTR